MMKIKMLLLLFALLWLTGCSSSTTKTTPCAYELQYITPAWEEVWPFYDGYAVVKNDNKYGVIDRQGNPIVQPIYDDVHCFSGGYLSVYYKEKDGWAYMNTADIPINSEFYSSVHPFVDDYAVVKQNNLYGVIDKQGNTVLESKYEMVTCYKGQLFVLRDNKKEYLYYAETRSIISDSYERIIGISNSEFFLVYTGSKCGVIDNMGKVVIEPQYDVCTGWGEDLFCFLQDGTWVYVDKNNKVQVKSVAETSYPFSCGRAICISENEYYVIDQRGKTIGEKWAYISTYYDDIAVAVYPQGGYTYLDIDGNTLIDGVYTFASDFHYGYAIVGNLIDQSIDGEYIQWSIVDQSMDLVSNLDYALYVPEKNGSPMSGFLEGCVYTYDSSTNKVGFVSVLKSE